MENSKNVNIYQQRYFKQLSQTKEHTFYLLEYIQDCEKWNWRIDIFIALASSSAIGAWAIWQELKLLWSIIIALSQVITTIKPLLRSKKRLEILYPLQRELEIIYLDIERNWYEVARGKLTEKEINELTINFKEKIEKLQNEKLGNNSIPENKTFIKKAKIKTKNYILNNFH